MDVWQPATRIAPAGGLTAEHAPSSSPSCCPRQLTEDPASGEDEEQDRPLTAWSDAPRILAAEGTILIARYAAACTPEAQAAIRRLSTDSVRAVRGQISHHIGCVYNTAPNLFWELLEHYARNQHNPTMLVDALHALRRIPVVHAVRTAALAKDIFNQAENTAERNDVRDAAIHVFCSLYLHASEPTCTAIIERLIYSPVTFANDVQRLILDLSVNFATPDASLRERVYNLLQRILTNITTAMGVIEAANAHITPRTPNVQAEFGGLLKCADEIARRLYFASGAFRNSNQDREFLPADVFYEHAAPLLAQLAVIGYHPPRIMSSKPSNTSLTSIQLRS